MKATFILLCFGIIGCSVDSKNSIVIEEEPTETYMDSDGDGYFSDEDCDDNNSAVFPTAEEICDGLDNDCDSEVDEEILTTYYSDSDGDGFGDGSDWLEACSAPDGFVPNSGDCDDLNSDVYPAALELCDEIDNDCDLEIDEGLFNSWYQDIDGDGFGNVSVTYEGCPEEGFVDNSEDCDDNNLEVSPNSTESCDEVDNNCDGQIDEGLLISAYIDSDEDGYGDSYNPVELCEVTAGYSLVDGDCDDINSEVTPAAIEVCDGIDNNCDGLTDDATAIGALIWYRDADLDGFGDPIDLLYHCDPQLGYVDNNLDCAPTNNSQYPGALEYCNGIDDDCNGQIDEGNAIGSQTFYADMDGDGFGDNTNASQLCQQPSGSVSNNLDCDDGDDSVYLSAPEICDGQVNSCGNLLSLSESDLDTDGYVSCTIDVNGWDGVSSVLGGDDCDDNQINTFPGALQICDGEENTCAGTVPSNEIDDDNDGYVECTVSNPWAGITGGQDCDDSNSTIFPTASELCDGLVNECGTTLNTNEVDDDGDGYVDCSIDGQGWQGAPNVIGGDDCIDSDSNTYVGAAYSEVDTTFCMTDADGDGFGDQSAQLAVPGTDCDDSDSLVNPTFGTCAEGFSCKDIYDNNLSQGSGVYLIDPDGYGQGLDPFEVYCDMTVGDAGWTEIPYSSDLTFQRHFYYGDAPANSGFWLGVPFSLELSDAQITAIQLISLEGKQEYVGLCNHVIHHYFNAGGNYGYAFGFEMFDGTILGGNTNFSGLSEVSVTQDGCAGNGGENGSVTLATVFAFDTPSVPVTNVSCRDCGDGVEKFGSPLTANSAWLR